MKNYVRRRIVFTAGVLLLNNALFFTGVATMLRGGTVLGIVGLIIILLPVVISVVCVLLSGSDDAATVALLSSVMFALPTLMYLLFDSMEFPITVTLAVTVITFLAGLGAFLNVATDFVERGGR